MRIRLTLYNDGVRAIPNPLFHSSYRSYLRNGRLVWPLLVGGGAAPPPAPPPPSLVVACMKGRARPEMVADLAVPFWLVLEEDPADARWMPLSPLELPELKERGHRQTLVTVRCSILAGCACMSILAFITYRQTRHSVLPLALVYLDYAGNKFRKN